MTLTKFEVMHSHHDEEGTLIHCYDCRELVLALVLREALDDHFNWPKRGQRRPSLSECNRLVARQLAAFEPIIQVKYQQKKYKMLDRYGSSLKMIEIDSDDLKQISAQLSDELHILPRPHPLLPY